MCEVFKRVRSASGRAREVFVGVTNDISGSTPRYRGEDGGESRVAGNAPRQCSKGIRAPKYNQFFGGVRIK